VDKHTYTHTHNETTVSSKYQHPAQFPNQECLI